MSYKLKLLIFINVIALMLSVASFAETNEPTWKINTAKNIDIHQFITQISTITGKTFIVDPKLRGQVTVISDTPLDKEGVYELFLSVLRLQNYTAVPSGNLVKIQQSATGKQAPGLSGDLSKLAPEGLVTRVIRARRFSQRHTISSLSFRQIPHYPEMQRMSKLMR